jgi:hypothetical protein
LLLKILKNDIIEYGLMRRIFDKDTFIISALHVINQDDELMHTYLSLEWWTCFKELNM